MPEFMIKVELASGESTEHSYEITDLVSLQEVFDTAVTAMWNALEHKEGRRTFSLQRPNTIYNVEYVVRVQIGGASDPPEQLEKAAQELGLLARGRG